MKIIFFFTFLLFANLLNAQVETDSLKELKVYPGTKEGVEFSYNQLIIPTALIAVGVYGSMNGYVDNKISNRTERWNGNTHMDDVLPFVAPATVYILNWSGVPGKHNFIDRSVILGASAVLALGPSLLMKHTLSTKRPDGKGDDSFPSFHTAAAFVGAEFMRQEYQDQSVWYGVAGYGVAACTGFLRIYNNRHWLSDVLVGAGMGILGTKAAYWLYPEIRKLYQGTKLDQAMIVPFGSNQGFGLSLSASF